MKIILEALLIIIAFAVVCSVAIFWPYKKELSEEPNDSTEERKP